MAKDFYNLVCWSCTVMMITGSFQIANAYNAMYPDKVTISTGEVKREAEVSKVPKLNPKSSFCMLPSSAIDDICRACTEVHQSVYDKFKYKMLKDIPAGDCELRSAYMGEKYGDAAEVYVRSCPMDPQFYISQGNSAGWVLVFTPNGPKGQLKFAVHLGPFDNKRFFSTVWNLVKMLIPF